ncbi:MAG: SpoIID/LytB domain-containing protein [Deltaproteobacteria bacterium]|nr:SpoIID/LytB domain-containing protein [Deltaproteobacteria bacterium]
MFSFFWGAIFGIGIYFASAEVAEAKEFIRVLLLRDVSRLEVSGRGLVLQDLKTGQRFFKNTRFSSLTVKREAGNRLRVEGYPISAREFLLSSSNGPVLLNGRRYRDKLKIFPGQKRDLWVINELPLQEYLVGLINYEISSEWFLEVAKAQAVVARTYATFQKRIRSGELYDVESGVNDQVYGGIDREDERSRRAVDETDGELLLYQGNPIFAVYHACCGGKTESPEYLWSGNFPYLKGTHCSFCLDSPHFYWNYQVDRETLGKALKSVGFSGSVVWGIEVVERSPSGRVLQLLIKDGKSLFQITGKELRRVLGYDLLRSTNFVVQESGEDYLFSGLGWGHGIGMCQWGAKGMAEKGADYRGIIHYYYQKVEVGKSGR